jgi:hypothetical protein
MRELSVDPNSMLVLGLDTVDGGEMTRLQALLEGPQVRPVLIVRAVEAA